ncbi:double-stranded RNA-binding protein Staufen homolog 2-like [Saccoglossus kowalevskii]
MSQVQGVQATQPPPATAGVPPGMNQTNPKVVSGPAAAAGGPGMPTGAVPSSTTGTVTPPVAQTISQNMANPKEKTPMCLLNELARYNKTQPQYKLQDESGPAHQKTFNVSLTLNNQVYDASGSSIKKAQHAAAEIALQKCGLPRPKPRPPRVLYNGNPNSMTPTVELNGLAMKRGEPAIYRPIEANPRGPQQGYYNRPPPNYNFRGMYNQRYRYPMARPCYVSLTVGNREFIGDGRTRQQARHNAALKALKVLRNEPLPEGALELLQNQQLLEQQQQQQQQQSAEGVKLDVVDGDDNDDDESKSEISQCYESAHRRNLPISFEVINESGPPHMKTFITRCTIGEYSAEAEGNGKKVSKKRAAAKVLEQLKVLPALPVIEKPRPRFKKKKPKSLVKVQQSNQDYGLGMNPVSRLVQIQQAKKEKEPVFTLLQERGQPRKREFIMQVTIGSNQCTGIGPNKKMAKRAAAEAMLQLLGYRSTPPLPNKSALKTEGGETPSSEEKSTNGRKVTFADSKLGVLNRAPGGHLGVDSCKSMATTATIAKELLINGKSPTADALIKSGTGPKTEQKLLRPKQQLMFLAEIQGLQVEFTDFPKGNKPEYLSLVSIATNPPLVAHGAGPTVDSSYDAAALQALKSLTDMDIGSLKQGELVKPEEIKITDPTMKPDIRTDETRDQKTANSLDKKTILGKPSGTEA